MNKNLLEAIFMQGPNGVPVNRYDPTLIKRLLRDQKIEYVPGDNTRIRALAL